MNKEEAQKELERLERIEAEYLAIKEELLAIIDKPESTLFEPEFGEKYFFSCFGELRAYVRDDSILDLSIRETTEVFKNEAKAKRQIAKNKATIKYLKKIAELAAQEAIDSLSQDEIDLIFNS